MGLVAEVVSFQLKVFEVLLVLEIEQGWKSVDLQRQGREGDAFVAVDYVSALRLLVAKWLVAQVLASSIWLCRQKHEIVENTCGCYQHSK
jgi:hypothetical protein